MAVHLPRMYKFLKVVARIDELRSQYHATRLWNWVDNQAQPEPYWSLMQVFLPWAFCGVSPNDFTFVYERR